MQSRHTLRENANHAHLLQRFADRLLDGQPRSVLDVGCGEGALLERCRGAGVDVCGVESDSAVLASLRVRGFDVVSAAAEQLPWGDLSFDWVTLRHVPHHLPDPAAAFAEAARVGVSGLLIAEPWFDVEIPSQRTALAVDRWLKRQHRRAGMVHGEALSPAALLRALSVTDRPFRIDIDVVLRLRPRPIEHLQAEAESLLAALAPDAADRVDYAALLRDIERDGLSWNGSVMIAVRFD